MNGNDTTEGIAAPVSHPAFVDELTRFHSMRGTTLKIPKFNRSPLDLERLWHAVRKSGGSSKVCETKHWAQIGRIFGGTTADKNVSNNIKRAFTKWLLPYEREFFPDQAMSATGEHAVVATAAPRRKRQQTTSTSTEKKVKANLLQKDEKCETDQPAVTEMEGPGQHLPVAMSLAPTEAPIDPVPPPQRSFVSIPHSTEPKYYIILLPQTATTQGLNGTEAAGAPMEVDAKLPANEEPIATGAKPDGPLDAASVDQTKTELPASQPMANGTDQFRVSLLSNRGEVAAPSQPQQLLPNIVVFQPESPNDLQGSTPSAVRDPLDDPGCAPQPAPVANVPCSGLLCLIDQGMQPDVAQAGMEQR